MRKWLILLFLPLILGVINFGIWQNEQLIEYGENVFLELAPVDPRSLMQGDYMALRFAMADAIRQKISSNNDTITSSVIVQLDTQKRASLVALDQQQPLQDGQLRLQFRLRNGQIKFATNAFFFQEGTGRIYEKAQYGLFRVGEKGKLILTHLVDAELQKIGQPKLL
ncbi:MAG: GDYXXLXY domain-containing protein [Pseudomonas sp.]|nr:GDYXXLXY domain-containing protein [Pseudomonas sp.]